MTAKTLNIWRPFSRLDQSLPTPIVRGEGVKLYTQDGREILDMISSWWVNLFGHAQPQIAKAIYEQAQKLEHLIFADFTHAPAEKLAEQLLDLVGKPFQTVFFSDNGSTSVEVALKLLLLKAKVENAPQRAIFLAFEGGYHGDTFGAMAVGQGSGFFQDFQTLSPNVELLSYPETWIDDESIHDKEQKTLDQLSHILSEKKDQIAGMILEPLVQGSSGMRLCRPQFLNRLMTILKQHQIPIIFDEVMTGFGRLGKNFAFEYLDHRPDIICLAKGLTGGFMPMSVTILAQDLADLFHQHQTFFAHGHSYTANPLACAAALASLELLQNPITAMQWQMIHQKHQDFAAQLQEMKAFHQVRVCGTILAFSLKNMAGYHSDHVPKIKEFFLQQGLLIRPLGENIYLMPPYSVSEDELEQAYEAIRKLSQESL